jgi:hypothetical protein
MGCVRTLRNGAACRGQRLNWGIGPGQITLCNRHLRQYNEERAMKLKRVVRDHEAGLHGTEERKQFAEQYASGEFYLYCQPCKDELVSEELGVKPDQVEDARYIKARMAAAFEAETSAKGYFIQRFNSSPLLALDSADDYVAKFYLAYLYRQVEKAMELSVRSLGENLNLVEAFERVVKEVTDEILEARLLDPVKLKVASRFVHKSYW